MAHSKPNLLYIHSDQHDPYVTGCYGDKVVQTPNLDSLAANGVVFENCYCPSPICVPSRMSMLSGRYPFENEVWTNSHILNSSIPTFAHAMGAGGYDPVLVGRMHSNGPDQLHGYAQRLVGDHGPNHPGGGGVNHGMLSGTAGPARVQPDKIGYRAKRVSGTRRRRNCSNRRIPRPPGRKKTRGTTFRAFLSNRWIYAPPPAICRTPRRLQPLRRPRTAPHYLRPLLRRPASPTSNNGANAAALKPSQRPKSTARARHTGHLWIAWIT